mmetsp:Transcript_38098/g.88053  ORF Transcript_38098/g.88053 Transcript_38098/m.88053 type:complete len:97 (-) Transcript_38098:136-426(-)
MEDVYLAHLVHVVARREGVNVTLAELTGGKMITWAGGRSESSKFDIGVDSVHLAQNVTACSYLVHGMKTLSARTWADVHASLRGEPEPCYAPIEIE